MQSPQTDTSINGFPLRFRLKTIETGETFWLPRGISRDIRMRAWKVTLTHEEGTVRQYLPDCDLTPLESLNTAFATLTSLFENHASRFRVKKRRFPNRKKTRRLLETGFTGITVHRETYNEKARKKRVVVKTLQSHYKADGLVRSKSVRHGAISEAEFSADPSAAQARFETILQQAVAIRRYHNDLVARGRHITSNLRYDQVPKSVSSQTVDLYPMDLEAIFDSFQTTKKQAHTTGGEADTVERWLRTFDLTSSHAPVDYLGHRIAFRQTEAVGDHYCLPTGLYRALGEWRIRVYHANGVLNASIRDAEYDCPLQSLEVSRQKLIDSYQELEVSQDRLRICSNPILDTCVRGLTVIKCGWARKDGQRESRFSFVVNQTVNGSSRPTTVLYGSTDTLTDADISTALVRGTAMLRYRRLLLDQGFSKERALVDESTHIPSNLIPHRPIHRITIEDLRFQANQEENVKAKLLDLASPKKPTKKVSKAGRDKRTERHLATL